MTRPGSYRIASRGRSYEAALDPRLRGARRVRRILESLLDEILGEGTVVRARRVFERPREIFRLEIESPEMSYQRTTLLDRESLDALLAEDGVRDRLQVEPSGKGPGGGTG